ncbi:MAG: large conductance mechanosensitive channel protein MscL [Oscillospiraceae bacterium]|jgi:large conductance mechanosensitive channel|nr:large conductance mechanosensitive channel protein MscL [Oscillospiraceae bacterium]
MKKFFAEFKTFVMRGNVMELAVAVLIGGAFSEITKSLANDILSPLIGLLGGADFSSLVLPVFGVNIKYGAFLTAVINFLTIAIVVFVFLKIMNTLARLGKKEKQDEIDSQAADLKTCPFCCSEINAAATRCPNCTSVLDLED